MSGCVEIVEMGPRDGLQNEPGVTPVAEKLRFINALGAVGFCRIEIASFVNPARVPQMADGAAVFAGLKRVPGVRYGCLVPNMRGLAQAVAAGADDMAVFASASDGFSQANLGMSVADSLTQFEEVATGVKAAGAGLRGYVSCVTDCPYDGPTPPDAVARVVGRLFAMGCDEVSLGDTIGRGTPQTIAGMLRAVLGVAEPAQLAGHFHDTGGQALGNIEVALESGLRVFDASTGGLGGCPFAPGASGNVATEAVAARLAALGYETGLDADRLADAARIAQALKSKRGDL